MNVKANIWRALPSSRTRMQHVAGQGDGRPVRRLAADATPGSRRSWGETNTVLHSGRDRADRQATSASVPSRPEHIM